MTKNNRVIWHEGLFLQPQHFQQLERYVDHEIQARATSFRSWSHGFNQLVLDPDLLACGRVGILKASGFFPDGTYFSIPDRDPAPPCLDLSSNQARENIFLALRKPHWTAGSIDWDIKNTSEPQTFLAQEVQLPSLYEPELEPQAIQVAQLQTYLRTDEHPSDGLVQLQLCEVAESGGDIPRIDTSFIEPCLCSLSNFNIHRILKAVLNLLETKVEQLRQRRIRRGSHNSSEIGDFLLLQSCVQQRLTLAHLLQTSPLHPESAYRYLLNCLGAVSLHGDDPAHFEPAYRHHNLRETFAAVHAAIRNALAVLHDPRAVQIPLVQQPGGVHIGQIHDMQLLGQASFYLTVHALAPDEQILRQFPCTVKIGPVDKLRDLVNLNLPGVRLKPVQPGLLALPYYADHLYFQLDTRNDALWKMLEHSGHLAIHYAGDLPELRMELWAVRQEQEHLR